MTIALDKILFTSPTRVRLVFSGALAGGAFDPAKYSVSDVTLGGPGPAVVAALAIASMANQVELVLATELATGHAYTANCTAVPAADLSTFTGAAASFLGAPLTAIQNVEPEQNASDDLVFGRDLVHNGLDYVEDASGDLASVGGLANVQGALYRRTLSYGLPWDREYGPRLDDYVDGPNRAAEPATGLIKRNVLADDRVSACVVTLEEDATAAGGAFFKIAVTLKTDRKLPPFDVAVGAARSAG